MTLKFSFIFPLVASLVWIYDGTWASPLKRPIITRHNILFDSRHQSAHGQRQPSEKLLRALRGGSVTLDDVRDGWVMVSDNISPYDTILMTIDPDMNFE
mmetsp:Transcript_10749/g.14430  ORF Transcript_10749/g.14430 Transcript_10749/m.14430 type:complete len:99 (-) Transcript_10749:388-684(-)